jgi:cell division protein FtsB
MKNFQDKTKQSVFHRIVYSGIGMTVLGLILVVFASGVVSFALKMQETVKNKKIAEEKVAELERRREKLREDIDNLSTDKGKEKIFRENFGMGRDGEGLIIVVEDKNQKDSPDTSQSRSLSHFFSDWFK